MFDYTMITKLKDNTQRVNTYQAIIKALGIEREIVHGKPLFEGGTPQALFLKELIQTKIAPDSQVSVYFQGSLIA